MMMRKGARGYHVAGPWKGSTRASNISFATAFEYLISLRQYKI